MFADFRSLTMLLGMGPPVIRDWDDRDDAGVGQGSSSSQPLTLAVLPTKFLSPATLHPPRLQQPPDDLRFRLQLLRLKSAWTLTSSSLLSSDPPVSQHFGPFQILVSGTGIGSFQSRIETGTQYASSMNLFISKTQISRSGAAGGSFRALSSNALPHIPLAGQSVGQGVTGRAL
mmetsp:Transcript_5621/g.8937  ORF Transcript_5621/g.8937 Transcript_5621/m.8937 type:complete len:174 (-) Transcript_5621:252-773(-)